MKERKLSAVRKKREKRCNETNNKETKYKSITQSVRQIGKDELHKFLSTSFLDRRILD